MKPGYRTLDKEIEKGEQTKLTRPSPLFLACGDMTHSAPAARWAGVMFRQESLIQNAGADTQGKPGRLVRVELPH